MTTLDLASRSAERGQLLASIDDLEELIRDSVQESEDERTLPISCVEAMRAADLFRIAAPKEVGGLEVDPLTHMEIVEAMAKVDGSAAWTLMIEANAVIRKVRNPDGKVSEGNDVYNYRLNENARKGELFLTDEEWALLTPGGGTGAFTITPGGYRTPDSRAAARSGGTRRARGNSAGHRCRR